MFLTPTYDDDHLPVTGLDIGDMQLFWKRLRKALPYKIRTFYCGEYGDRTQRPHYHAAVFGLQPFGDEKRWDSENMVSATLTKIWGKGTITLSELTPDRMAYVAGYVMKKAGYRKQYYTDGTGVALQPPFRRMSNGIGKAWLVKYAHDLREGCVHHEGFKAAIPRYYLDTLGPQLAHQIQKARQEAQEKYPEPVRARLDAAETIRRQQIKKAKRDKL